MIPIIETGLPRGIRVQIVRSHRPDSWTTRWIGEVLWTEQAEPYVAIASVYGSPWAETEVLGWDVALHLLTVEQLVKFKKQVSNLVIGTLFVPVECCKVLPPT